MLNHKIAEKLLNEGQKIDHFFSNLSELQLRICVYHDEQEWQIRDVLAHFISAEKSFLELFENIRKDGQGVPVDFSINEFNNSEISGMKDIDPNNLLAMFRETRTHTIEWLNGLDEEDLEKEGRHPAMGDANLREMIKMIYLHNQMHIRDLRTAIKTQLDNAINMKANNSDQ